MEYDELSSGEKVLLAAWDESKRDGVIPGLYMKNWVEPEYELSPIRKHLIESGVLVFMPDFLLTKLGRELADKTSRSLRANLLKQLSDKSSGYISGK